MYKQEVSSMIEIEAALDDAKIEGELLECEFTTTNGTDKRGTIMIKVNECYFLVQEKETDIAYVVEFKNIKNISSI